MTVSDSILARVSVLEAKMEKHESLHSEFMLRTDERLEVLLAQSSEWAGVRKTLAVLVAIVTTVGGFVGWAAHTLWPHGVRLDP